MMKLARVVAALVSVAGLIAAAPAGAANPGPQYVGTEYDQGGGTQAIDGPLPQVEQLADQITRTTDDMLRDLARERAKLPYGSIESDHHAPPQLTTYPPAPGSPVSDQYSVTLGQRGRSTSSFVYQVAARKTDTNLEKDTSWTSFSFAGPVAVRVHKLSGTATGCLVRPESARIRTHFADGTCSFALTAAANVSVEFTPNTTNPVLHPMLVFANPPEVDVPPASDPNVLYLGPGLHQLGTVQLHSNQTVYIAGGAWVQGTFKGLGVHNVVIRGRGVIDGTYLDTGDQDSNKSRPGLIDIDCHDPGQPPHAACSTGSSNSSNVVVDGLTFVNGPRFNVRVLGDHITVHNLKVMSWWYSTDCIWAGTASLVEGNFCKVNDDALKPMTGDSVIRDNVVWQLENGAPFMISWNILTDQADFHVYDNDVIHAEHYWLSPQAIFRARHATPGHLQRFLFEDIRVEDANWRLFYIILEKHPKWYDPALGFGQISGLVFRDITAQTPFTMPNVFTGGDPDHRVSDVTLMNVAMNGTCVANAADGNFQIDPATTDQVRIVKSAHAPCSHR
ncbi:hypothetical protein E0H73_12620 [Kribbella pittospori]|uniref:Right-handed parallel beta-helix repeat-containing protein n=2 Tax=Kribbella pittospori TaxID=722689 RepID=A0A4R0KQX7_9ACTN|nr:hypothetical protein E0H73_12620 [Kribbella pittospori]